MTAWGRFFSARIPSSGSLTVGQPAAPLVGQTSLTVTRLTPPLGPASIHATSAGGTAIGVASTPVAAGAGLPPAPRTSGDAGGTVCGRNTRVLERRLTPTTSATTVSPDSTPIGNRREVRDRAAG